MNRVSRIKAGSCPSVSTASTSYTWGYSSLLSALGMTLAIPGAGPKWGIEQGLWLSMAAEILPLVT